MDARRPGVTLIELMVVIVISGFVLAAVVQTIVIQQRSHSLQDAVVSTRQTIRTSMEILQTELRELSASDGDLLEAEPNRLAFRAFRKIGFICAMGPGASQFTLWELGDEPFAEDDRLLIFADGDPSSGADDAWIEARVNETPGSASCSQSWVRYDDPGESYPRKRIGVNVAGGALNSVLPGAPVRGFVPMTYGAYEIDGEWVVGREEEGKAPVALIGPIAPPAEGGLVFRYYDENGNQITPTTPSTRRAVRRIEISIQALGPVQAGTGQAFTDELTTHVYLRGSSN